MKKKRHERIIDIVEKYSVETQEDLIKKLRKDGFTVTQATVSRDIKELRLVKTLSDSGSYRYSLPTSGVARDISFKYYSIFSDSVIDIDYAGNIVCIKCHTGMANAACAALDTMNLDSVVGTIAGDDTIFLLLRSTTDCVTLSKELKKLMNT